MGMRGHSHVPGQREQVRDAGVRRWRAPRISRSTVPEELHDLGAFLFSAHHLNKADAVQWKNQT